MEAKAIGKYLRISPRKVRLVLDTIRRKEVDNAFAILANLNKKAARLTEKVLKSAVANAKEKKMSEEALFVSEAKADGGPTFKRYMARAMGRADRILKRTTHITLKVSEKEKKVKPVKAEQSKETKKKLKKTKKKTESKK